MPLHVVEVQVFNPILDLAIIATDNIDIVQILLLVSVKDTAKPTLSLTHFNLGMLEPNLAIKDLDRINPHAIGILPSHNDNLALILCALLYRLLPIIHLHILIALDHIKR